MEPSPLSAAAWIVSTCTAAGFAVAVKHPKAFMEFVPRSALIAAFISVLGLGMGVGEFVTGVRAASAVIEHQTCFDAVAALKPPLHFSWLIAVGLVGCGLFAATLGLAALARHLDRSR